MLFDRYVEINIYIEKICCQYFRYIYVSRYRDLNWRQQYIDMIDIVKTNIDPSLVYFDSKPINSKRALTNQNQQTVVF